MKDGGKMKLIKTASGNRIKISKSEWTSLGKEAGWMKETWQATLDFIEGVVGSVILGSFMLAVALPAALRKENNPEETLKEFFDDLEETMKQVEQSDPLEFEYASKMLEGIKNAIATDEKTRIKLVEEIAHNFFGGFGGPNRGPYRVMLHFYENNIQTPEQKDTEHQEVSDFLNQHNLENLSDATDEQLAQSGITSWQFMNYRHMVENKERAAERAVKATEVPANDKTLAAAIIGLKQAGQIKTAQAKPDESNPYMQDYNLHDKDSVTFYIGITELGKQPSFMSGPFYKGGKERFKSVVLNTLENNLPFEKGGDVKIEVNLTNYRDRSEGAGQLDSFEWTTNAMSLEKFTVKDLFENASVALRDANAMNEAYDEYAKWQEELTYQKDLRKGYYDEPEEGFLPPTEEEQAATVEKYKTPNQINTPFADMSLALRDNYIGKLGYVEAAPVQTARPTKERIYEKAKQISLESEVNIKQNWINTVDNFVTLGEEQFSNNMPSELKDSYYSAYQGWAYEDMVQLKQMISQTADLPNQNANASQIIMELTNSNQDPDNFLSAMYRYFTEVLNMNLTDPMKKELGKFMTEHMEQVRSFSQEHDSIAKGNVENYFNQIGERLRVI